MVAVWENEKFSFCMLKICSVRYIFRRFMVIGVGDFMKWLVYLGCISGDLIQGFGNMQMFSTQMSLKFN
jgi:hypothetical protein